MGGKNGVYWFAITLGLVLFLGCVSTAADLNDDSSAVLKFNSMKTSGIPHAPIAIDSDTNFTATALAEGWPGNGTAENPFIIEGLDIDQGGLSNRCISISNTLVNFTIRNCFLSGANETLGSGVYLNNVTYGDIFGNIFDNNYDDIYLTDSHYLLIENNNCSGTNNSGISLVGGSNYTTLFDNICKNSLNGIVLNGVSENTVVNNTCDGNVASGILCHGSNSNSFENNTCLNNSHGILLNPGSNYNTVHNNTCSNNTNGIHLHGEPSSLIYNIITDNLCDNNSIGILLYSQADHNGISNNSIVDNNLGIHLDGYRIGSGFGYIYFIPEQNTIQWNDFTYNDVSILVDYGELEVNLIDYNYWSDYSGYDNDGNGVGDTPYTFTGTQDPHPLMAPVGSPIIWLNPPIDQTIIMGESFRFDLNASVYGGLDYWWINDTSNFIIDQFGIIQNNTIFPAGIYGLLVYVNDTLGNVLSGTFALTVSDIIPPTWIEQPTTQIIAVGTSFWYDLNATDISGIHTWWINDTMHFAIDTSGVIVNITHIPGGIYGLHVWVNDTSGNALNATFNVVITDIEAPTWINEPMNQEFEEGTPYFYSLLAFDLSGIDKWWVNDTIHFAIDEFGVLFNKTALLDGVYTCRVWVNDTLGNTQTGVFTLTVHPALPPMWLISPIDQIVEFGGGLTYDLDVTDFSDIDLWWLNDTTYFTINQDGTITNSTPLSVGTYSVLISVCDVLGYTQSSGITILVEDTTAPSWIQTPVNQIVEFGEYVSYDLNFTDLSEIDDWWVDDSLRFSIDWTGQVRSLEILEVGTYGLQIFISDIYDNTVVGRIVIEVVDTTPPEWRTSVTDQYLQYGEKFAYQLSADDLSGIDHWSVDDTTHFEIDSLGLISSIGILEIGSYNLRVIVADPYGNELLEVFTIHVISEITTATTTSTTTTTTITTTTTTTDTTPEGVNSVMTFVLGIGIGGAAVAVTVLVLVKMKKRT